MTASLTYRRFLRLGRLQVHVFKFRHRGVLPDRHVWQVNVIWDERKRAVMPQPEGRDG